MEILLRQQPRIIGSYTIGKTIGEGTFGKVKLGFQEATGEKVAIKILVKKKICDVADVERVSREIHILKLIRHHNIIQLYEVKFIEIIETPKKLYLIMEYANGGELFDYIVARTVIKEPLACKFFEQLIAGIDYIHRLGVVHRDLKPENLLLHNKNIKIVDFGLSNTYEEPELLKTACGSPCYAAPEMIAGKKYKGLKADIWSAGIILFAMVCGYLPFEDPNTSELYKKILAGNFKVSKTISLNAKDLINKILVTDPDQRIDINGIREHPWFKEYNQEITPGILVGYDNILVDSEIIKQLKEYGYNLEYTQKCIEANKHNNVTAAYYLLLKKHIDNGGESIADIGRRSESPVEFQTKQIVKKMPYNPHPPLVELSQEPLNPFHNRFRRFVDFKNQETRKEPLRTKATSITPKTPIRSSVRTRRLSVDLKTTLNPRKPVRQILQLKSGTPRPQCRSSTAETRKNRRRGRSSALGNSLDLDKSFRFQKLAKRTLNK